MCGRFQLDSGIGEIIKKCRIQDKKVDEYDAGDFCPSQNIPIVIECEKRNITYAKWGFAYNNKKRIIINARAESIMDKPMFRNSFYNSRCVIPANAFYEWRDEGNKKKTKYRIGLQDESLILLGGVYKKYLDENLKEQLTFVIITTEAEGDIKPIHSRMPLIIKNEVLDIWLNENTAIKLVNRILESGTNNRFIIEECKDEHIKSINGKHYEQIKMF